MVNEKMPRRSQQLDRYLGKVLSTGPVLKLAQRLARTLDPVAVQGVLDQQAIKLSDLDSTTSYLLNLEKSSRGFSGMAGLWINQPVNVWYETGNVTIKDVNERIVEWPFVSHAVQSACAPGARILDFGANESLLSLELASLGYQVLALDSRGYAYTHPNIEVVRTLIQDWEGPSSEIDAVVSLSTLEHLGLGFYDSEHQDLNLDRRIVDRFYQWLKPSGRLVLTVPFGNWKVTAHERTYDRERLVSLLEDWNVEEWLVARKRSHLFWETSRVVEAEQSDELDGVALIVARKDG